MERRVKRNSDYWFEVILGGILTFALLYSCGNLIFTKLGYPFLNVYYFIFCVIVVVYYQWKDDNFESFETKLSKSKNFILTKNALDKLKWGYEANSTEIKLNYNKYVLKFLCIIIIPKSEKIYFNFKYESSSRIGRLPFYFGINTILKWKFKQSLKSELNKKPNA